MKTTAATWLSREEIRELMTPSDLRGAWSLVTTWGVIALAFALLYLAWVVANATTFSLFLRIRSIAEHAVTEASDDPLRHTT